MAAHRYWRALNLGAYDGGMLIALSAFWLLAGSTRVDAAATLTGSAPPVSGSIANLADGSTSTDAVLARGTVLQWDFGGSPQDITDIRLGATEDAKRFPLVVILQWSDNGSAWTQSNAYLGIAWPGVRSTTTSIPRAEKFPDDKVSTYTQYALTAGTWTMGGGQLLGPTSSLQSILSPDGVSVANGFVEAAISSADDGGLVARLIDANNYYLLAIYDGSSQSDTQNRVRLWKCVGGTFTQIATAAVITFPRGERHTFRLAVNGSAITGSFDGTVVISASDSSLSASGRVGVRANNPSGRPQAVFNSLLTSASPTEIARNVVEGRASSQSVGVVASAGGTPAFAGAVPRSVLRARPNYLFNPTANGRVRGTVALEATPTDIPWRREVTLFRQVDKMPIQVQWSDAVTGEFDFQWIETDQAYFVYAEDYELNECGVVADNLTLGNGMELMP